VASTLRAAKQLVKLWEQVGLAPDLPALGPYPVEDSVGFRVAAGMLLKSLEPGRYNQDYQQYKMIRKLRAGYSNLYMASVVGTSSLHTMGGDHVKHYLMTSPTQSAWFERFSLGCAAGLGHHPSSHACSDGSARFQVDPSGGGSKPGAGSKHSSLLHHRLLWLLPGFGGVPDGSAWSKEVLARLAGGRECQPCDYPFIGKV